MEAEDHNIDTFPKRTIKRRFLSTRLELDEETSHFSFSFYISTLLYLGRGEAIITRDLRSGDREGTEELGTRKHLQKRSLGFATTPALFVFFATCSFLAASAGATRGDYLKRGEARVGTYSLLLSTSPLVNGMGWPLVSIFLQTPFGVDGGRQDPFFSPQRFAEHLFFFSGMGSLPLLLLPTNHLPTRPHSNHTRRMIHSTFSHKYDARSTQLRRRSYACVSFL